MPRCQSPGMRPPGLAVMQPPGKVHMMRWLQRTLKAAAKRCKHCCHNGCLAQRADHESPLMTAAGLRLTFSRYLAKTMLESQTVLPRLWLFGFWARRRVMLQQRGSCEALCWALSRCFQHKTGSLEQLHFCFSGSVRVPALHFGSFGWALYLNVNRVRGLFD